MYTVYKITDKTNGKLYIGQTKRTLDKRWRAHCYRANCETARQNALIQAIREHGCENFMIEPIEECPDRDAADERERYWIAQYNSKIPYGYNHTIGGDNHGLSAEEFREKVSGANHWTAKKEVSKETRAKMSAAQSGAKSNNHKACMCIETGETFPYVRAVTRKYGIDEGHIHDVCKGKRQRCGGFHWKYIPDSEVIHNKE